LFFKSERIRENFLQNSPNSIFSLTTEFFELSTLTIDFSLVGIDLALLIRLLDFPSLELITHERATAEPERAANRSSRAGMPHCCANDTARRRAAQSADPRAFLTCAQAAPRAADDGAH
jgi:hypothetical protein